MPSLTRLLRGAATTSLTLARTEQWRRRVRESLQRALRSAAWAVVGAVLMVLGLAFLLAAVFLQLRQWIGAKGAAAVLAATLLAGAAACWAAAFYSGRRPARQEPARSQAEAMRSHLGEMGQSANALRREVTRFVADRPELVILSAFLVGLLSGRRRRRKEER